MQAIIALQGGISIVIYADVLFIVNFFITFLLLEVSARAGKRNPKTVRLVISSVLGGLYSMIILADGIPVVALSLSKILFVLIIILISFGFKRLKSFVSMALIFLFCNFVFLGIISGFQMIFKSKNISINNGEIYFDINAKQLLITALFAYIISILIIRIYNSKLSAGEIYSIVIFNKDKSLSLYALSDSGNKLREPFSDSPVIVVDKAIAKDLFKDEKSRLIPASTVNKSSFLEGYKPEYVLIKTPEQTYKTDKVYIALSEQLKTKSFSAVLSPEILSV